MDALVNHHLASTRPDSIEISIENGRRRTYRREAVAQKAVVGPDQTQRQAAEMTKAVANVVAKNGLLDEYGDMQAGSKVRGKLRTAGQFPKMAAAYSAGINDTLPVRLQRKEHLFIERRPVIVLPPDHVSPMPLHLNLGIAAWLL